MSDMQNQIADMISTLGSNPPAQQGTPAPAQGFMNPPVVENPAQQPTSQPLPTTVQGTVQTLDGTVVDMATINPPNLIGTPSAQDDPASQAQQPAQQQQQQPAQVDPTITALQQQLAQQSQLLQAMQLQLMQGQQGQQQQQEQPIQIQPVDPSAILKQEEVTGLVDDSGTLSVSKLVELMQKVGQRSYQLGREHTVRDVPSLVEPVVTRQAALHSSVNTFWATNNDLQPFRQQLSQEANSIAAQAPHLPLNTVLNQAAASVRAKLSAFTQAGQIVNNSQSTPGILNQMVQQQPAVFTQQQVATQVPGFVPNNLAPQGTRPNTNNQDGRSQMEKDIDAMLNAVG